MSKINAALCITELAVGGAEKAFAELAVGLNRERFEPVVYVLRGEKYHDGNPSFLPKLRKAGIPVFFLDVGGSFSFARGVSRLTRLLKEQNADFFLSFKTSVILSVSRSQPLPLCEFASPSRTVSDEFKSKTP